MVASWQMSFPGAIELSNPLAQGKVRDIYDAGPDHLLMVATDRI